MLKKTKWAGSWEASRYVGLGGLEHLIQKTRGLLLPSKTYLNITSP
jgi:hypothetical protein